MRRRIFYCLLLLGAYGITGKAAYGHSDDVVFVDPKACAPVAAGDTLTAKAAAHIGMDWSLYRPFMCLYPVATPDGKTVLHLLALDIQRAGAANALIFENGKPADPANAGATPDPIPNPLVIDLQGRILASLSAPFLNNNPPTSAVGFTRWKHDFPRHILLRINNSSVETTAPPPYCPPPLVWHVKSREFIQEDGDYYAPCK